MQCACLDTNNGELHSTDTCVVYISYPWEVQSLDRCKCVYVNRRIEVYVLNSKLMYVLVRAQCKRFDSLIWYSKVFQLVCWGGDCESPGGVLSCGEVPSPCLSLCLRIGSGVFKFDSLSFVFFSEIRGLTLSGIGTRYGLGGGKGRER
jgi:hypothetical protein